MVSVASPYEYRVEWVLPDDQAGFTRQITVRNIADKETILQYQAYATPPLVVGKRQAVVFPEACPSAIRRWQP